MTDHPDIVERLADGWPHRGSDARLLCEEAAAEITRLRAEADQLRSVMIAAAPDLLEALIHIQQVACSGSPELAIATEAIAKATGEQA